MVVVVVNMVSINGLFVHYVDDVEGVHVVAAGAVVVAAAAGVVVVVRGSSLSSILPPLSNFSINCKHSKRK